MLSILIPTYNYNALPLVKALHHQGIASGIVFEILCFDDGSKSTLNSKNDKINTFQNCKFQALDQNIGRSAIRNLLAKNATYQQLLFLDVDTELIREDFIKKYLGYLNSNVGVIYGGIEYQKNTPEKKQLLRWKYGKQREALAVTLRNQKPHISLLTLNFLVNKSIILAHPFNEDIPNLRHEDTLFALNLKKNNITVSHIDNPVLHLGLETNKIFLKKSLESTLVLHHFLKHKLLSEEDIKLTRLANQLMKTGMHYFINFLYTIFKPFMEWNLLSAYPSLRIFDLYRLGYFFKTKKND